MEIILVIVLAVQLLIATGALKGIQIEIEREVDAYGGEDTSYKEVTERVKQTKLNKLVTTKLFLILTLIAYILTLEYVKHVGGRLDFLKEILTLSIVLNGILLIKELKLYSKEDTGEGSKLRPIELLWAVFVALTYGFTYILVVFNYLTEVF